MESNIWYPYDGLPSSPVRRVKRGDAGHRKLRVTRPASSASRPVGRVYRPLGASKPLDDAQRSFGASLAGFLLPSYRDTRSYGYHMLDSIH